jgi:hypothetical protein
MSATDGGSSSDAFLTRVFVVFSAWLEHKKIGGVGGSMPEKSISQANHK